MDIETETLIFEARILAESIAMGLGRINDPSEIDVMRGLLSDLDAILSRASVVAIETNRPRAVLVFPN